jgi:cation transport regulator ChaB
MPTPAKKKVPPGAEARLDDLDVREVSVVDRPANKKRFLIVKRRDGNLAVLEEKMPRQAIARTDAERYGLERIEEEEVVVKDEDQDDDAGSFLDILDLVDVDVDEEEEAEPDEEEEEPELEVVEKTKAGAAAAKVKAWLGQLSAIVSQLKKLAGKDLPGPVKSRIASIAKAITAFVGAGEGGDDKDDDKAEKASADTALRAASGALQKLMSAAAKLKAADKASDVPSGVVKQLSAVAALLAKAGAGGGGKDDKEDDKDEPAADDKDKKTKKRLEVYVSKGDGEMEIIFKAGRKMKKARLNQFRKAVETLKGLLDELEGADGDDKATKKSVEAAVTKALEGFSAKLGKAMDKLTETLDGKISDVNKRVDDLDNTRPAGEGDEDTDDAKTEQQTEINKSKKGMWSNLLA